VSQNIYVHQEVDQRADQPTQSATRDQ